MKNRGITLIETLISVTVFGIIMIVMFQMSSSFFKLFHESSSQQDMNSAFIKAYAQIKKDFMTTSGTYTYSYNEKFNNDTYKNIKNRWILFPVATDQDGHFHSEGKSFNWKRVFIYYLECTNQNCKECSKLFSTPEDLYKKYENRRLFRFF